MRFEVWTEVHLEAHQFGRVVGVLLTTLVTADGQAEVDGWRRRESIGLSQRDLVSAKKILVPMKFVVLADDNPAIGFVLAPRVPGSHEIFLPKHISAEKWRILWAKRQQLLCTILLGCGKVK